MGSALKIVATDRSYVKTYMSVLETSVRMQLRGTRAIVCTGRDGQGIQYWGGIDSILVAVGRACMGD
jgi:hypothetical protein